MTAVVPVRFKYNPKTYWYSYSGCQPHVNDYVVIARDAGMLFGWVEDEPFEITPEQERDLKTPLRGIVRLATPADLERLEELRDKGAAAKQVFRELAEKRGLNIKPIDVEYYLDTDKAIFHFSSEERVDFRELVRDLAGRLHVHVDMKQIGVRDEARVVGGFGHCGEVLCCVRMSSAFKPVSISMAKEQDLPLNPGKVSGACGRLMCCLRYEFDVYKDFKSRAPKMGATIKTPAGDAKVVELNAPKELVRLRMVEGDERFFVPLSGMQRDPDDEPGRPNMIDDEVFAANCPASMLRDRTFSVPESELLDPLASDKPRKRRRKGGKGADRSAQGAQGAQGDQAARSHGTARDKAGAAGMQGDADGERKQGQAPGQSKSGGQGGEPRRSRSRGGAHRGGSGASDQRGHVAGSHEGAAEHAGGTRQRKQRPGQNSSGVRNPQGAQRSQTGAAPASDAPDAGQKRSSGSHRRRRGGSGKGTQAQQQAQAQQRQQAGSHRKPRRTSGGGATRDKAHAAPGGGDGAAGAKPGGE